MAISPILIARLWQQHASALTLLARARCSAPDDCVQEAFIRLAQQPEMPREPVPWLSRVVRNEAISQWRSDSRRARREETAAAARQQWFESHKAMTADPLDRMALTHALESLEIDDREILIAHVWTGLSFRQISDSFELSLTRVHRRYQAALKQLRLTIEGCQPVDQRPGFAQVGTSQDSGTQYHA